MTSHEDEKPSPAFPWWGIALVIGVLLLIGLGSMGGSSENKRIAAYKRAGGTYY